MQHTHAHTGTREDSDKICRLTTTGSNNTNNNNNNNNMKSSANNKQKAVTKSTNKLWTRFRSAVWLRCCALCGKLRSMQHFYLPRVCTRIPYMVERGIAFIEYASHSLCISCSYSHSHSHSYSHSHFPPATVIQNSVRFDFRLFKNWQKVSSFVFLSANIENVKCIALQVPNIPVAHPMPCVAQISCDSVAIETEKERKTERERG